MAWPVLDQIGILAIGFGLGLSLAAPPGPILALAAERAVRRGFWPGVAVPLGATTGDATQAVLMGLGVLPLIASYPDLLAGLNVGGAILLFWFAWMAWQAARAGAHATEPGPEQVSGPLGGFGSGYALALTSPYNFAWWIGAGTALFQDYGPLLFVGFFSALVLWSLLFVGGILWADDRLEGLVTWISYASAFILVGFGGIILWRAAGTFV